MAGQDAVLDAASLKREAHVRAPIVEGEDAPTVVDDKDRAMTAVQDDAPLRLKVLKAAGEHEFPTRHVHKHSL
jgi:hypothetical protein